MSGISFLGSGTITGHWDTLQRLPSTAEQLARLCALLGLTEQERAFVREALGDHDRDIFLVLADYLEERGRDESAARFRSMGQ